MYGVLNMKIETVTGYKCSDGAILGSMDDRRPSHEIDHGKSIDDLPGMWCESDLSGGWAD